MPALMESQTALNRNGLALGIGCYSIWGIFPVYLKLLHGVPPYEVVTYRILFTLVLMTAVTLAGRRVDPVITILRSRRLMLLLLSSALLIAANWVIYIWAVSSNHLMAASLGYFLNPLVNVGLGVLVLGERLRQAQKIAIGIAAIGVAIAASTAVTDLWISLSLAVSFAIYGLIRKSAPVSAVDGLTMETVLLSPVCLGLLFWWSRTSPLSFGQSWHLDVLLMFSAVATSLPLTMFARAAQLLPYATLGLIQYISPLIVFLLANFVYHEPMHPLMLVAFGFIWVALMVFTVDLVGALRATRPVPALVVPE